MQNENNLQEKKEKTEFSTKTEIPVKIYQIPQNINISSEELSSDKNIETDEERNSSSNNNTPSHKMLLEKSIPSEYQKQKSTKQIQSNKSTI